MRGGMAWVFVLALVFETTGMIFSKAAVITASKKSRNSPATRRAARPRHQKVSPQARKAAQRRLSLAAEAAASIAVENPAGLVAFFEQLYRHQLGEAQGPVRILHYGDSHTAADEWTGTLRNAFQSHFGDGGAGFIYAGRPWYGYRRLDVRGGATRGWHSEGLAATRGDGRNGMGGVSIWTARAGESVWLEAECRRLEIFYLQQPGGGRIEIFDNGESLEVVSTAGDTGAGCLRYDASAELHRFEIRTLDRAPVRLLGWAAENERGVTYEPLGINGAQASIVMGWDQELLAAHLARREPSLIVLAYGTNEAGNRDCTPESYRAMYLQLLQRLRKAAPAASILLVGPPDRMYRRRGKWLPYPRVGGIIDAQREVALSAGCAFWDMRAKMGGEGAMRDWVLAGWAQPDHVHLSAAGYYRIGAALFEDLMSCFSQFMSAREAMDREGKTGEPRSENP